MLRGWTVCSASTPTARVLKKPWPGLATRAYAHRAAPRRKYKREILELCIPEESKSPVVESDFSQYLSPLYRYGWGLKASEAYPHGALSRSFQLPNFTNLASFTTNTQNTASADIIITPTGKDPQAILWLHSPEGITRSLIRSAVETETEYRKLVGSDAVSAPQRIGIYQVRTLERLQALISKNAEKNTVPRPENRVRMKPGHVPLPPAPLIPASPPPPLTEVDFETYIAPLFDNGWQMSGIRTRGDVNFKGLSSLARAYRFTTYSAARHFLQAAVALMPAPVPGSVAGVRIEMHSTPSFYEVSLESMSELAPGALQKYGISLADARFAIEVENEISKNWAEHVDASAASPRFIPKTLEELWNRRPSPKPRPYLVYP